MILPELLAVLSISAATGLRLALPLLLIGLFSGEQLWAAVPILANIPQMLVVAVLVIWSLLELTISKDRVSRRFLQSAELFISPFVGTIAGVAIARLADINDSLTLVLLAVTGGVLALVIQMVQVGWLYRFNSPPMWMIFVEDALCICLVFFAFDAPEQGGLIALFLLWFAIRSSAVWRQWQKKR
ncbi:DUF4126 domain-containing protein [Leptolyngbyaceae cyanobacterium CCMR0082]|uniref:DUF4126 domain-containing protein n=2 Tax=Adonisia turfae TaxID=2950184 RepID=A0A6M0SCU3_9CYAN|nr:DUF4126 domain-containing protein [Leptothoe sp. LEGE 181152]NEZ56558.1 DUF4126 domain-containing protein [Adonisia turfae CCMR0081]NEZ66305.1 DUF4126 domain-containing protein [Adonisia turfae CCMR0082]